MKDGQGVAEIGGQEGIRRRGAAGGGRLGGLVAAWSGGEHGADRMNAVAAFLTRVFGAGILYLTQVVLARIIGSHEFGLYVYAWTLVIVAGDLVPFGFAFAQQRLIPSLQHDGDPAALTGFLLWASVFVLGCGAVVAFGGALIVLSFPEAFADQGVAVLVFAATALPAQALANVLDGMARSFNHTNLALAPGYIVRPLMIILLVGLVSATGTIESAATVTLFASLATWCVTLGQALWLGLLVRRQVPVAAPDFSGFPGWFRASFGLFAAWASVTLFTYTDIVVLNHFSTPDQVAIYYATGKTLALTSFVTFAIAAVMGHRLVALRVAGDRDGLDRMVAFAVKWTFWPSLAITLAMLAAGRPILALFGKDFSVGYELLFILSFGMLARASVGPAERMLNMLGESRACAAVYVGAFAANLMFCLVLVPRYGLVGAAIGVTLGMFVEAGLLAWAVRRRLGLAAFIVPGLLPRR